MNNILIKNCLSVSNSLNRKAIVQRAFFNGKASLMPIAYVKRWHHFLQNLLLYREIVTYPNTGCAKINVYPSLNRI